MEGILAAIITVLGGCIYSLISKLDFRGRKKANTNRIIRRWICLLSFIIVFIFIMCVALYFPESTSRINTLDSGVYDKETKKIDSSENNSGTIPQLNVHPQTNIESMGETTIAIAMPTETQETDSSMNTILVSVDGSEWTFLYDKGYLIGEVMVADYNAYNPHGNIQYGLSIVLDADIEVGSYGYVTPSSKVKIVLYSDYYDGFFHEHLYCESRKASVRITSRDDKWEEYEGNFDVTVGRGGRYTERHELTCDYFRFTIDEEIKDDSAMYVGAGYFSGSWRTFKKMNSW